MPRKLGTLIASLIFVVLLSLPGKSSASDDQSRDHGSRATREAKKNKDKKGPTNGLTYRLGLFGGAFVEGPTPGVMGDAMLGWELRTRKHKLTVSTDYLYEPFSTKTFNFPEEDQAPQIDRRLVQGNHIWGGDIKWRSKWNKWLRSSLRYTADGWWPDFRRDRRWAMRLYPSLRFGKLTGAFGEIEGQLYYKKFPNYRVADRSIDQRGYIAGTSFGYNFDKLARLSAGFTFEFTDYLDARYNALDSTTGEVIRATQSKDYLVYTPWAEARLSPGFGLDFSAKYKYEVQRTRYYDREMTGRTPEGVLEAKLLRNYYDFRRSRISWSGEWEYKDRLSIEVMSELWVRRFDNYEARNADNVWTGQLRLDTSVEVGGEFSVRVVSFDWLAMENNLHFILFASHLRRRSNMQREVSLATNFEITRVFAGFELSGG